tara:strand:+ start:1893 stop:2297 length:405 start_codon:yes stop_codon:yes gene_type:complete
MQTQLLCTFSNQRRLTKTVDVIIDTYDVIFNKIFVLEDVENPFDLMCTYNIDRTVDSTKLDHTISLHRKKQTNTLYTINALNRAIEVVNNGVLDTSYQLDWENYRDCILLTNENGLRRIDTAINDIIHIKVKKS